MSTTDSAMFDKWKRMKDPDAFTDLFARHSSMVYGACFRILRNQSAAEEVAQECFVELLKGTASVRSVGGWLHTIATRRALDRLKADIRQRERETRYAAAADTAVEPAWDDVRGYVDEAIEELPEELRAAVVLRFLDGQPHRVIARELGVSRSTVRLRIQKGIASIRASLSKRGIDITATALSAALVTMPVEAVPAKLTAEMGRRALAAAGDPAARIPQPRLSYAGTVHGAKVAMIALPFIGIALAAIWIVSGTRSVVDTEVETRAASVPAEDPAIEVPETSEDSPAVAEEQVQSDGAAPEGSIDDVIVPVIADEPDAAEAPASVSGWVTRDRGEPVPNATVYLVATGLEQGQGVPGDPDAYTRAMRLPDRRYKTESDGDGFFRFDGVRDFGVALVCAEAEGLGGGRRIDLAPGQSVPDLSLVVNGGAKLVGRVLTADGKPVANALVQPMCGDICIPSSSARL